MNDLVARPPAIAVTGATKRFGAVLALEDMEITVAHGEVVALFGDNGAGKSTLIKCISGVHRLDAGVIEMDGEPVADRVAGGRSSARDRNRLPGSCPVRQPRPGGQLLRWP